MSDFKIESEIGYCPEIGRDRRVEVRFLIAKPLGGVTFPPEFNSTKCPDEGFCRFVDKNGYCPLLNEIVAKYSRNIS